jgi:hypothetical protein
VRLHGVVDPRAIYAGDGTDGGDAMAGVLLYTAAPDSEGTLGGLVSLGEPEHLEPLLRQALERAQLCSSDPLCAEHDPRSDGRCTPPPATPASSPRRPRASAATASSTARRWSARWPT